MKGLKLVELWLNRNPLCDLFKDQAAYIRSVSNYGDERRVSEDMTQQCGIFGWVQKFFLNKQFMAVYNRG